MSWGRQYHFRKVGRCPNLGRSKTDRAIEDLPLVKKPLSEIKELAQNYWYQDQEPTVQGMSTAALSTTQIFRFPLFYATKGT